MKKMSYCRVPSVDEKEVLSNVLVGGMCNVITTTYGG